MTDIDVLIDSERFISEVKECIEDTIFNKLNFHSSINTDTQCKINVNTSADMNIRYHNTSHVIMEFVDMFIKSIENKVRQYNDYSKLEIGFSFDNDRYYLNANIDLVKEK